jgi:hypothetical protein
LEWVDGRMTGYIDGQKWFESTDRTELPPGPMQQTIQVDWFDTIGSPVQETKMDVDWVHIYQK